MDTAEGMVTDILKNLEKLQELDFFFVPSFA
jgi:hypothetical protein